MKIKSIPLLAGALLIVVPLVVIGCGGGNVSASGGDEFLTPQPTTHPTTAPTTHPTTAPTTHPTTAPTTMPTAMPLSDKRFVGQITSTSGFNGDSSAINFTQASGQVFGVDHVSINPYFDNNSTAKPREIHFTVFESAPASGSTAVGSYPVKTSHTTNAQDSTVFYSEGANKGWEGTGGTIIVDSESGDTINFRFVGVKMTFARSSGSTSSQGTFTLNGTGRARSVCSTHANCGNM